MSCNCRSYTAETVEMLLLIALSVHARHMENFITEILLTPCLSPNKCYNKTAGAINQARQKGIHMALFGLFGKKETGNETIPQNDVEKWILGTYAMWAAYADGDWHYIAGSAEKNKQEGASMRVMLRRDWEVSNKTALLDMVDYLTALYREGTDCEAEDIASGAWDLCRACQILGMGFVGTEIGRGRPCHAEILPFMGGVIRQLCKGLQGLESRAGRRCTEGYRGQRGIMPRAAK